MTTNENVAVQKVRTRTAVKKTASEGVEKLEEIAKVAKTQVFEVVTESQEAIQSEVDTLNQDVQSKLQGFKQELLNRIDVIKGQFNHSQQDLFDLKDFIKAELNLVLEDLNKLTKELKDDVSQISLKHKDHLTETYQRSKKHTLEAWSKVYAK